MFHMNNHFRVILSEEETLIFLSFNFEWWSMNFYEKKISKQRSALRIWSLLYVILVDNAHFVVFSFSSECSYFVACSKNYPLVQSIHSFNMCQANMVVLKMANDVSNMFLLTKSQLNQYICTIKQKNYMAEWDFDNWIQKNRYRHSYIHINLILYRNEGTFASILYGGG